MSGIGLGGNTWVCRGSGSFSFRQEPCEIPISNVFNHHGKHIWASVLDDPYDDLSKLAFADICGENGEPWIEKAVRWCVGKGKWPRVHSNIYAEWYVHNGTTDSRFCLPRAVFVLMANSLMLPTSMSYSGVAGAITALADTIEAMTSLLANE